MCMYCVATRSLFSVVATLGFIEGDRRSSVVAVLAFCVTTNVFPDWIVNRDQEWGELFLYFGVLIVLLRSWVLLGPQQGQEWRSSTGTDAALPGSLG